METSPQLQPSLDISAISRPRPDRVAALSDVTTEWLWLAEQIALCGRLLRDGRVRGAGTLSQPQFSVLWACHDAPPAGISQAELADRLSVSAAHVSGIVEQLRCKGLLQPRRLVADRRRQLWKLTPTGQLAMENLASALRPWAEALQQVLGTAEVQRLGELVRRLSGVLRSQRASGPPALAPAAPRAA
jgi:DNA-binding MarR family transcriptional regulator